MIKGKRKGESVVPDKVDNVLNAPQLKALQKIEGFGWKLKFVRRPLFQEVMAAISNPDEAMFAVLKSDGEINTQPGATLRSSD